MTASLPLKTKLIQMKNIFKILPIVLLAISSSSYGQVYSTVNSPSRNAINSKESLKDLEGEPYLFKDYQKAFVKFANGSVTPFEIKYDQLADEVVVKSANGQDLGFTDPVLEFKFADSKRLFRNNFASVGKNTEKTYYEVLFDGRYKFLKRAAKTTIEFKQYNGPTVRKVEEDNSFYVMRPNGIPEQVKLNDKSILSTLRIPELDAYAKANKLNLKNEADVVKLLTYADSLIK